MNSNLFKIAIFLIVLTACKNNSSNYPNSNVGEIKTQCIDSLLNSDEFNRSNMIEIGNLSNLDFYNGYRGLLFGLSLDSINYNSDFESNDYYSSGKIKILITSKSIKNNLLSGNITLTFYDGKLRMIMFKSYSDAASDELLKMFGKPNIKSYFESNRESFNRDYKKKNPTSPFAPEYINFDGEYSYSHYIWQTKKSELEYSDTITTSIKKADQSSKMELKRYYSSNLIFSDLMYKNLIKQLKIKIQDSLRIELKKKAEKDFVQSF